MESKVNHEEIDLLKVLAKFCQYMLENWIVVVILPIVGGVAGYLLSVNSTEKYESKMMIRSEVLSATVCDFLLKQFERSYPFPDLTPEQNKMLVSLKHEMVSRDPLTNPNREIYTEITIQVRQREALGAFQKSILDFLENNETAIRKKKELKDFYTAMIAKIDHELKQLDDVKANTTPEAHASALRPSDLFTASVELTNTRVRYEQGIKNERAILVIEGFDRVVSDSKKPPVFLILTGICTGVLLLLPLLFLKYFFRYYTAYRKTESA